MKAIDLFNNWVTLGKDDGMELNHSPSVNYMLSLIPKVMLHKNFSFLDVGCGNGWVVRRISKIDKCNFSVGLDGSENMIRKAISKDKKSQYLKLDINHLQSYNEKFDIVFSMEVVYYLKNPQEIINYIVSNLLKVNGCCIIGIDHYIENTSSLTWKNDLNVEMCTYSILEWENIFKKAGFSNIKVLRHGVKKDWKGTLILYGEKNNYLDDLKS